MFQHFSVRLQNVRWREGKRMDPRRPIGPGFQVLGLLFEGGVLLAVFVN